MKRNPYLVCVTGLKNSGKTTVCTAIIADLSVRGYGVAALKSSHVAELTLDHRAGDSYALAAAGARFVLVQGSEQSLAFEQGGRTFQQMIDRIPEGMDFVISEGGEARTAAAVVVCLAQTSAWEETLKVRRIPQDRILAVSGLIAGAPRDCAPGDRRPVHGSVGAGTFQGYPLIDIRNGRDRQSLIEGILKSAGRA